MNFLHGWIVGIVVLVVAIVLNWIASIVGIATWYSFLSNLNQGFWSALGDKPLSSFIFLFAAYPGLLGVTALVTVQAFLN